MTVLMLLVSIYSYRRCDFSIGKTDFRLTHCKDERLDFHVDKEM